MYTLEQIRDRVMAVFPTVHLEIFPNASPANQPSLLIDREFAREIAEFLRDDPDLRFDYASNVTGVDWPKSGFLEAVYHLYSMALGHGPLIIRLRTENRSDSVTLPSLTPVWRSCELQEREVFDLFGVQFKGHPDLRRILMWDGFADYPMRKDYMPTDCEGAKL
jgi:NADH-quinone oxidoreductase subunit C